MRDRLQRRKIAVVITFAVSIAIGAVLFAWQQQQSKQTIEAVFLSAETTKILNSLPDFLTEADKLKDKGNIERSLPYYRRVRAETVKLLRNFKGSPEEKSKIKKLSDRSEESLAQAIEAKLIKNLDNNLKNGHYDDALKKTYDILMPDNIGAGADLNNNSRLDSLDEADMIPCKTLIAIRNLWLKYTQNHCDWYGSDSPYQAPNCTELNKETLTTVIFEFPYDYTLKRIDFCYQKFDKKLKLSS